MTTKLEREKFDAASGVLALEPRAYAFDQVATLSSGVTIEGNGARIKNTGQGGYYPLNCTLRGEGSGFGHVHGFTHAGRGYISTDAAAQCPPGTLIYCWVNNGYLGNGSFTARRTVVERSANFLRLNEPIEERLNVLKWFTDASPIDDVSEGSRSANPSGPRLWTAGETVLVGNGPSIANEANGEYRTISSRSGSFLTFGVALRRSYKLASIAKVKLTENVTIKDLTIELPVNVQSESLYLTKCRNWLFVNCRIPKIAMGNCSHIAFINCDIGWVQAAASCHDLIFQGSAIDSITFEEGCHDNLVMGARLGPVGPNMNCVSMRASSERLTLQDSHLLGGASPSSQILFDGPSRDCVFDGLTLTGKTPCWIRGNNMVWRPNCKTDGDLWIMS